MRGILLWLLFLLPSAPVVGRRHITVTTGEELQNAIGSNVTIYFGANIMLDENALDENGIQIYGTSEAPIVGLILVLLLLGCIPRT